ncbi:MAG TPA: AmmeMemoRadiSam system protein B [Gammaproteobacteria bacterium]|nr:AmmeMemoRadiSam system protein B [Gammaproteobacteria bacterium]
MTVQKAIRAAAVAGLFYPEDPAELRQSVASLLRDNPAAGRAPRAVIVPHAGYIYSGPVAARAYQRIAAAGGALRRIVILGPAHRVALNGMALPTAQQFRTPLGDVPLDTACIERLAQLPGVMYADRAHRDEHGIEVQLPFLQSVIGRFTLVPVVVGACDAEAVRALLEAALDDGHTLIIISSDLSHYHPYAVAQALDLATAKRIERLDEPLGGDAACGAYALNGLLAFARQHHLRAERLDLRNSGDTAGPKDRVVGYGAWAICDA